MEDLERLRALDGANGHRSVTVPMLFSPAGGGSALEEALEGMFRQADAAVDSGATMIILTDRGVDAKHAPIPALLATSAVHHHLIRAGTRTLVGLVVESGEPREVHHMAVLLGYGASAICPYLAYESIDAGIDEGLFIDPEEDGTNGHGAGDGHVAASGNGSGASVHDEEFHRSARYNYRKALLKGIVKVISKMGISTIQGYQGAQVFESVGICRDVVDRYFTGTAARLSGVSLEEIAAESAARHLRGYAERNGGNGALEVGGDIQWRDDGEYHLNNPQTIHKLQRSCQSARLRRIQGVQRPGGRPAGEARDPARLAVVQAAGERRPAGRSRARGGDRQALQDRRHVLRVDQQGGARDPGDRHEPDRRQEQHRRRGRGPGALRAPTPTATPAAAPSSRWPRPASA